MTVDSRYISLERDESEFNLPLDDFPFTKFLSQFVNTVILLSPEARFLYANDAACHLLELSRKELFSRYLYDLDRTASPDWLEQW